MYSQYRGLSEKFDSFKANAELFSYLRNKFAGHLTNDLVEKALEWKPELKMMLDKEYDPTIVAVYNLFFLETAINTYVDDQGRHKFFDSETDLLYPQRKTLSRDTTRVPSTTPPHSLTPCSKFCGLRCAYPKQEKSSLSFS